MTKIYTDPTATAESKEREERQQLNFGAEFRRVCLDKVGPTTISKSC